MPARRVEHTVTGDEHEQITRGKELEVEDNSELYGRTSGHSARRSNSVDDSEDGPSEEDPIARAPVKRKGTFSKDYTQKEEKAVLRKIDRKLILLLGFLYMLSFLDRSSTVVHMVYLVSS